MKSKDVPSKDVPNKDVLSKEVNRLLPGWLTAVVLVVLGLFVGIPLLYIVFASLNTDLGVARGEFFPSSISLDNFIKVFGTVPLYGGLVNSLIASGVTAIVCAAIALVTAYVLVRFDFPGRLLALRALLGMQSIPGTMMVLPVFVVFSAAASTLGVQVIGTRWGLMLTYMTFALPFSTWVMVTYLRGLPRELEEAARIDGASNLTVLSKVVLPLAWPGMIVSAIFAFLLGWNDVLFASVITSPENRTAAMVLQVFLATNEGGAIPLYGQMMAAALICAAPVVLLYLIFQRYLIGGLTAGGVK